MVRASCPREIMLICLLPRFLHELWACRMLIAHSLTCIQKCCNFAAILRTGYKGGDWTRGKSKKIKGWRRKQNKREQPVCKAEVTSILWELREGEMLQWLFKLIRKNRNTKRKWHMLRQMPSKIPIRDQGKIKRAIHTQQRHVDA